MTRKCLMSFVTYSIFSAICFVSMHLMLLADVNKYVGVGIGGGILAASCIIYIVLRVVVHNSKKRFIPALLFLPVSAVGCGLAMSSLYVYLGEAPNLLISFCVWGAYAVLFLGYCFLGNIPFFKRDPYFCITVYGLFVLAGGIVGICLSSTVIFSLALMTFILFIGFLATILVSSADYIEHIHILVLVSFIGLFIVVIVVLIVISGGDGLDGLGGGDPGSGGRYRDRKYNPYDFSANEQKKRWMNNQ